MELELLIATVILALLAVALVRTKAGATFNGRTAKVQSEAVLSTSTPIPEGAASFPASTTTQHLQQELPAGLTGRRAFFISMCAGAGFAIGVAAVAGLPVIIYLLL